MRRVIPASAFVVAIALRASAATLTVNPLVADAHDATPGNGVCETATGNGMCTLRAAIDEASALGGASTIDVPSGTYLLSVAGGCDGVALCVTGTPSITLTGAGAATTVVDANAASNPPNGFGRVLDVASGVTMTVSGVTFTNGASQPAFPGGM